MTVSLTTLYNRLGGHFGIAKTQLDARAGIVTRVTNLDAQYTAATRYMYTPLLERFLSIYNSTDATISAAVQGGVKTLTEMVNSDNANIPKQTLPAMRELVRQMRSGSTSLLQNTVTIGAVSRTGTGTGTIVFSSEPSQMSRTDLLQFECISDTTTGSVAGSEVFRVTGSTAYPNINDSQWPGGTGLNTTMVSSDYVNANIVTNGTFETWVSSVPSGWTVVSQAAQISQLTTGTFRGTSALKFTGNGSMTKISQSLPVTTLGPGKRVVFGFWYKKVAGTPSRDISMELEDNTGGAAKTLDALASSTSWTLASSSYQSAWDAPVTSLTATLGFDGLATEEVAVDGLFVFVPPQQGTNGQFFQIIGGGTDWRIGDRMTVQVTNDYASSVLSYTERFFAPFANGIEVPTSGSPTVNNSVIP